MQVPELSLKALERCGLGVKPLSWLRGIAGACAQKPFSCQVLLLHEREEVWSGFQAQDTTSKAAGPTETEAGQTVFALWRPEG